MLEVRKVRVGDVKLTTVTNKPHTEWPHGQKEAVKVKAETGPHTGTQFHRDGMQSVPDWASLHMNLSLKDAVAPGAELLMAVADEPRSNDFVAHTTNKRGYPQHPEGFATRGHVNIPENDFFSFIIDAPGGGDGDEIEVRFQGNQASDFVRALLRWWLFYEQK